MDSSKQTMPTPTKVTPKIFLAVLVIATIITGVLVTYNQQITNLGAQLYPLPSPGSGIGSGPVGCTSPTPMVQVAVPTTGQNYFSGQAITVNWSTCGISTTGNGLLRLTKISGTGPASMGPFIVSGTQTSYTTQPLAALPGIFNGNNMTLGTYKATVTYAGTTGVSGVFFIRQSPLGLKLEYGPTIYNGLTANGQSEVYFERWATVMALGQDIYLDKDVLVNSTMTTGGQPVYLKEYYTGPGLTKGALAPQDMVILNTPTLVSLTPGIIPLAGGTYKIPAGTIAQFKITTRVGRPANAVAPYERYVEFGWSGFSFATSDTNGNLYEPAYNPLAQSGLLQKY